jgi:hypothetical protein
MTTGKTHVYVCFRSSFTSGEAVLKHLSEAHEIEMNALNLHNETNISTVVTF